MTKILLDVGLPRRAAGDLRQQGFAVEHASDLGMAKAPDSALVEYASAHGYVMATLDFDFARIVATQERRTPAIIHFRISNLDRVATVRWLSRILPLLDEDLTTGCIASVGPTGIRVRSLPLKGRGRSGG